MTSRFIRFGWLTDVKKWHDRRAGRSDGQT
jgi:hypothetical protein